MLRIFTASQQHIKRVLAHRKRRIDDNNKRGMHHTLSTRDKEIIVRCRQCGIPFQPGDRVASNASAGRHKSSWYHVWCAEKVGLL